MSDRLLTANEVANMFRVNAKTVTRWAATGRFSANVVIRTPGGHNRFWESKIREILEK